MHIRCVADDGNMNNNNCNDNNGVRAIWEKVRRSKQYAEISTFLSNESVAFLLTVLLKLFMTDFEKVCDFENLYRAYKKAKAGKGYKNSSAQFEIRALDGIHRLKQQLESKEYRIEKYKIGRASCRERV